MNVINQNIHKGCMRLVSVLLLVFVLCGTLSAQVRLSVGCISGTADLSGITTSNQPNNTTLTWHSSLPVTDANKLGNVSAVTPGVYYAAFFDAVNSCYSSNTMTVTITPAMCLNNVCPAATVNLNTALTTTNLPANTMLTWHTSLPVTAANKIADPSVISVSGTYYAAFFDATNNCYSGDGNAATEVIVEIVNCNPTANVDIVTVANNGLALTTHILSNDTNSDASPITDFTKTSLPTITADPLFGSATVNPDGTLSYTPAAGFQGKDSLVYQICDKTNATSCDTGRVFINVTPTIFAHSDNYSITVGTTANLAILSNDIVSNSNITIADITAPSITQNPTKGVAVVKANGTIDYSPNIGAIGTDKFIYQICDKTAPSVCDTALVTITISLLPNTAPVVNRDDVATLEDTPVTMSVLANDTDDYGLNATSVTLTQQPKNGTTVVNLDGSITYTPVLNFNGKDTLIYQVCDIGSPVLCDTALVVLTITSVNDAPIAINDIAVTPEGKPTTGNVLTNDTDADGTPLTVITTPIVPPTKGTLVINTDGSFTYTPTAGKTGEDKFCYAATDGSLRDTACVTVNIVANPTVANNKPVANDDNTQTTLNANIVINVKSNDTDADGNNTLDVPTSLGSLTARGGTVTNNNDGTFTYAPLIGFIGKDSIQYKICDTGSPSLCDSAWVTIEVLPTPPTGNQKPVAMDDAALTIKGTPVTIPVKDNDNDADGNALLNPTIATNPTSGTATVNADGTVTYTPTNPTFTGSDYFTYQICDNGSPSKCDTATVVISVNPAANKQPVAQNDIVITPEGKVVTGNVLTNDTDPDGTPLMVITTPIVPPTKGTLVINTDGTITYIPTAGQMGEDKFCYAATDGSLRDTACVTVNIVANPTIANSKPVANDDNTQTTLNTAVTINIKSNDIDADGVATLGIPTPLSITSAKSGIIVNNNDGTFTYTPPTGFMGKDSVRYKICDNGSPSLCDSAWVSIEVFPTPPAGNQSPVAMDDAAVTLAGTSAIIPVKANDVDPDGGSLGNPTIVRTPTSGTATVNADGTVTYTPTNPTFTGSDYFTYQICDNGSPSKCDTATLTIGILPQRPAATVVANMEIARTIAGVLVNIPILTNDTDNGATATLSNVATPTITRTPTKGTATVKTDGTIDYTPNAAANGSDTLIYQICDKISTTVCDTALVVINLGVRLTPRAYLLGCYNETADLMHDSLRRKNLIPLQQPYNLTEYSDNAYSGTETMAPSVLTTMGNNAIVDWVLVELRNPTDPKIIVARRAALIQRDGDIVDVDGVSPVMFGSTNPASYFVSVRHRNHLGVLTAIAQPLAFVPLVVDFTSTITDNYKTISLDKDFAQKITTNGKRAMWMGNIKKDNSVIFQGPSNDVNELYLNVLTDANNSSFLANYVLNGYLRGDVDMDGKTIYQGPSNEADKIFFEVVLHAINATYLYNFIINEQIPR